MPSRNETKALQAPVEGATAEAERSRGSRLVALRVPQGLRDCLLLDFNERLVRWNGAGCDRRPRGKTSGERNMFSDAEMGRGADAPVGGDQRALDGILQLPYVAGPGVGEQQLTSLVAEA